jgi:hypothetical protein
LRDPAPQVLPDLGKVKNTSGEKTRRVLGWTPRSREDAIVATAESLVRLGLLKGSLKKAAKRHWEFGPWNPALRKRRDRTGSRKDVKTPRSRKARDLGHPLWLSVVSGAGAGGESRLIDFDLKPVIFVRMVGRRRIEARKPVGAAILSGLRSMQTAPSKRSSPNYLRVLKIRNCRAARDARVSSSTKAFSFSLQPGVGAVCGGHGTDCPGS